jgi:hypothetical protein
MLAPRLDMPIRTFRSPLENWRGTSPIQAARCLPFLNSDPSPMAATIAVAVLGPTPLMVAMRRHGSLSRNIRSIFFVERGDTPIKVSEEIVKL